jgi:hypothetical protein
MVQQFRQYMTSGSFDNGGETINHNPFILPVAKKGTATTSFVTELRFGQIPGKKE